MNLTLKNHIQIQTRIWELAKALNGDWIPDWSRLTQGKYSIYFDHHPEHFRFKYRQYMRGNNLGVVFSEPAAKQACIIMDVEGFSKENGMSTNTLLTQNEISLKSTIDYLNLRVRTLEKHLENMESPVINVGPKPELNETISCEFIIGSNEVDDIECELTTQDIHKIINLISVRVMSDLEEEIRKWRITYDT